MKRASFRALWLFTLLFFTLPSAQATILGTVRLDPNPLFFPDTRVGDTSSPATVTVTKEASFSLPVFVFGSLLSNPFRFSITDDRCEGRLLFNNDSCGIDSDFSPNREGFFHSHLVVIDTSRQILNFGSLIGQGVLPEVKLSDNNVQFGDQPVGSSSAPNTVTVTNIGTGNLTVSDISLSGDPVFSLVSETCTAAPVPPLGTCDFEVDFTPTAIADFSGTVALTDDAPDSPQEVALSGTGVAAPNPALSLSKQAVDFGNQQVGAASAPVDVVVISSGDAPVTLNTVTSSNPEFALSGDCTTGLPIALNPGQFCTLTTVWTPGAAGPLSAQVTFDSTASNEPVLDLSGVGIVPGSAEVSLSATSLDFGSVVVGQSSQSQTITVTNTGDAPLNFTSILLQGADPHSFAMIDECGDEPVMPGESCVLEVTFLPAIEGPLSATIVLTDDASDSPQAIALGGAGQGPQIGGGGCGLLASHASVAPGLAGWTLLFLLFFSRRFHRD